LDEPSSGVDPISKKSLFDCLNQTIKLNKGSAILTTHSMSEAETIASHIGILINGKLVVNGTLIDLKNQYGDGYRILIKLND